MTRVSLPPPVRDPELRNLVDWFFSELQKIERAFNDAQDYLQLKQQHVEPDKIEAGQIVLADGSNWDPGSGKGLYWVKTGAGSDYTKIITEAGPQTGWIVLKDIDNDSVSPQTGMIFYTSAGTFNPGSGEGFYGRTSSGYKILHAT